MKRILERVILVLAFVPFMVIWTIKDNRRYAWSIWKDAWDFGLGS